MEQIVAKLVINASANHKLKTVVVDRKEYLVAPISMIVPGVLPGSEGPLLYTQELFSIQPSVWDYSPITVNHPMVGYEQVSAATPGILDKVGIGFIANSRFKDKLLSDGHFDVVRTKRLAPQVYRKLLNGEPIEISTGLYTNKISAPPMAVFNGRQYTHIVTSFRPDHLAVLVDQVGACSVRDGCGITANNQFTIYFGDQTMNRDKMIEFITANSATWKGQDTVLEAFEDGALESLYTEYKAAQTNQLVINKLQSGVEQNGVKIKLTEANQLTIQAPKSAASMTTNEWMEQAPPEVKSAVQSSIKMLQTRKNEIVEQLTANFSGDEKVAKAAKLQAKPFEDLQEMLEFMPKTVKPTSNWFAAAGGAELTGAPIITGNAKDEDADLLIPLKIDWSTPINGKK